MLTAIQCWLHVETFEKKETYFNSFHGNATTERRSNSTRFLANYERKFATISIRPSKAAVPLQA
jgi:hypothetical protein